MTGTIAPKPQHIVQINDFAELNGGAAKLAIQAACDLSHAGHRVTYITGDSGDNPLLPQAGVQVIALGHKRLTQTPLTKSMINGLWNIAGYRMIRDWISQYDTPTTVYHVHNWSQILSPSIFAALNPVRDRIVVSAHDFFLACPNGAFSLLKTGDVCPHKPLSHGCLTTPCDRDGRAQKMWRVMRQSILRQTFSHRYAPPILIIHNAMAAFMEKAGIPHSALHTVPNPVEPYSTSRIEAENNAAFLFVGRLEETKGADLAAHAAAKANVPITFVGDGPLATKIPEICPHAHMAGRRTPLEIQHFASRSRALLMPSRYPEPFGLVAVEATWSGLPVILSKTALLADDIVQKGAGLAIDPYNIDAFAQILKKISQDHRKIKGMSEAAHTATRHLALTPQAWIRQLETIYQQRLENSNLMPGAHSEREAV